MERWIAVNKMGAWVAKSLALFVVLLSLTGAGGLAAAANGDDVADLFSIFEPKDDRAVGAEQHEKIVMQYGGEYIQDGLNDYILDIVLRIVSVTDQRNEPWRVTVLNSPAVNAFALPGGFVYVTRGLLVLANNEAEVAGVLAHEVGHVIARHGVGRQSRATGIGILGAIAGVLTQSSDVFKLGQTLGGLFLADYSRDQEYEADGLGVKYLGKAGYPREAMADFLGRLDDYTAYSKKIAGKDGQSGQYDFFASHPQTEDRIERARQDAASQRDELNREYRTRAFLEHIDGILIGDDIREGVIKGRQFLHPKLRLTFNAPKGFQLINTSRAVFAKDRSGNQMIFDIDPRGLQGLEPAQYLQNVWMKNTKSVRVQDIRVGGASGAKTKYRVEKNGKKIFITAVVVNFGYDKVARFVYRSGRRDPQLETRYRESYGSFRPLAYAEAVKIKQVKLSIKKVGYSEDVDDLMAGMAEAKLRRDLFLLLNPTYLKSEPRQGDVYKLPEYVEVD